MIQQYLTEVELGAQVLFVGATALFPEPINLIPCFCSDLNTGKIGPVTNAERFGEGFKDL